MPDRIVRSAESRLNAALAATSLHRALAITVARSASGVTFTGVIGEEFARADGLSTMHGGAVATILDSVTTFAVFAETDRLWSTVDLRVDYLRPAQLGSIEAVGTVVHAGATVGRARGELRDSSGKLVATALATLLAESRGASGPGAPKPAT